MLKKAKNIFFLGIGGIGMSALAKWAHEKGFNVRGWDDNPNTHLIQNITQAGILVFSSSLSRLSNLMADWKYENSIIVYTPAISKNHKCLQFFKKEGLHIYKRSDLLHFISKNYQVVAISGTHGKTTISVMLVHILKVAGINCNAFFGGISKNYDSNLLIGDSKLMVVEADEYDRSFLKLNPAISLISSLDKDHGDIYRTKLSMLNAYNKFISKTKNIVIGNNKLTHKFDYTYSIKRGSDFYVNYINHVGNSLNFEIQFPNQKCIKSKLLYGTYYNVENAIGASAIAYCLGVSPEDIGKALISFLGVKRRLEYHVNNKKLILIDDYAHHPEELRALIKSIKILYKKRDIFLIFQPHLFSRTLEFENAFAQVLSLVDKLVLVDIYPAREAPIQGVNSQNLLKKINIKYKWYCNKNTKSGLTCLESILLKHSPSLLITAGAGDIDKLIPTIKSILK